MSQVQRDAISSPAAGATVYNTTTGLINTYNGTSWIVGGADNLGNHTATTNLVMATFGITNADKFVQTGGQTLDGHTGNPESVITGSPGDIIQATDGTLWVKKTGSATNTGWQQILTSGSGGNEGNSFSGTTDTNGDVVVSHGLGTSSFYITGITFQGS